MGRGQVSLEYLLVFSVALTVLISTFPVLSKAYNLSKQSLVKSEVDSVAREVSSACEEALYSGERVEVRLEESEVIDIELKEDYLFVYGSEGIFSKQTWSEKCSLREVDEEGFKTLRISPTHSIAE